MFPLSIITSPENTTQFKLVKDFNSSRVNVLLIHNTTPVTLYDNLLTFHDTGNFLELKRDPLKMITNKNYKFDLADTADKKLLYDFAKEMYFDVNASGNESTRDRTLVKLHKSPAIFASRVSTIFLPVNPNELCNGFKAVLQEKQTGKNSNITNDEIVALVDKLLEYSCIYTKQQKRFSIKCNLLHTTKN